MKVSERKMSELRVIAGDIYEATMAVKKASRARQAKRLEAKAARTR